MVFSVQAAEMSATIEWQQDVMADGDYWEVHYGLLEGGPYSLLFTIPYVSEQTTYQHTGTVDMLGKTYFVMKKVRGSDNISSPWSNEVSFEPVNPPYQLRFIISTQ